MGAVLSIFFRLHLKVFPLKERKKEKIINAYVNNLCWFEMPRGVCEIELLWDQSFFLLCPKLHFLCKLSDPCGRLLLGTHRKRLITTLYPTYFSILQHLGFFSVTQWGCVRFLPSIAENDSGSLPKKDFLHNIVIFGAFAMLKWLASTF